jgi:hypothetical protein
MLQDSLQRLAAMPENQRMEIIKKIISQVEQEEKEAAKKAEEEKLALNNPNNDIRNNHPNGGQLGNPTNGVFTFEPMKVGKVNFRKNGATETGRQLASHQ